MRRRLAWVVGTVAGLAVLASAATFVYIHFVEGKAPAKLTLGTATSSATDPSPPAGIAGTWKPTSDSVVGYRVNEVLFGQDNTAVGRTNQISGSMTIQGNTVTAVQLTVDMSSVHSDQHRRDAQFQNRIMDVGSFPTATFVLTQPIALPSAGSTVTVAATGRLTLRGTTKAVTVALKARQSGGHIEVNGTVPITFADWGIPNPGFGPVTTDDHGELELLVVFGR